MISEGDVEATAQEFVERFVDPSFDDGSFESGAVADAVDLLTDGGRAAVVDAFPEEFREGEMDAEDALEAYRWGLYGRYGEVEGAREAKVDGDEATVTVEFEDGVEAVHLVVGGDGVAGFRFDPEYETPAYVDRDAFEEREVTVDADDVDLGGVLTVPDGDGPFPAVLLVHGAGIHDPDGTAGASKVLKDFAWGLASDGIASLRYEKRLAEHEEGIGDGEYTLDTVVTDDAVASLDELATAAEVDGDALFVAGHSQGGMAAPRIAGRHGGVAGVVVLDGPAEPLVDPDDLDFLRYTIEPDGDLDERQEEQLESQRETFRRIADGEFDDDEEIMGKPGIWYRSVADCDPVGTASDLGRPVLVAKASRADEEIQPELAESRREDTRKWRAADLGDGGRVEFYEDVDHYFQRGPTPTTMTVLYFGGNVAGYVVDDLAAWIHEVTSR
jgi:pimeloyl-ACP methyl ester carboxylesterase